MPDKYTDLATWLATGRSFRIDLVDRGPAIPAMFSHSITGAHDLAAQFVRVTPGGVAIVRSDDTEHKVVIKIYVGGDFKA